MAGSQQLSNDGMLVILAAGDRTVYEDCSSCFQAMGKTSFFLGMLGVLLPLWSAFRMTHTVFTSGYSQYLTKMIFVTLIIYI